MRTAANGALISDDGTWYHTARGFRPLLPDTGPEPTAADLARAQQAMSLETLLAGHVLARLVAEHGSLAAAEHALGELEARGRTTLTTTYASADALAADHPRMLAKGWRPAAPPRPVSGLAAALDRVLGRPRRLRARWRRD